MTKPASWIKEITILTTCSDLKLRMKEKLNRTFKELREIKKLRPSIESEGQSKRLYNKSQMLSSIWGGGNK